MAATQNIEIHGRIDESGNVLLPVSMVASDGVEVEVEASVNLEFDGALAVHEDIAREIGWRALGSRRVLVDRESRLMDHYIGMVALGSDPQTIVVLGGINKRAIIGQRLLRGRKLIMDFAHGRIVLE